MITGTSLLYFIRSNNGGHRVHISNNRKYSGPSILRPPMGPRRCGLILQVVSKKGSMVHNITLWDQLGGFKIKMVLTLKTKGCIIEGVTHDIKL